MKKAGSGPPAAWECAPGRRRRRGEAVWESQASRTPRKSSGLPFRETVKIQVIFRRRVEEGAPRELAVSHIGADSSVVPRILFARVCLWPCETCTFSSGSVTSHALGRPEGNRCPCEARGGQLAQRRKARRRAHCDNGGSGREWERERKEIIRKRSKEKETRGASRQAAPRGLGATEGEMRYDRRALPTAGRAGATAARHAHGLALQRVNTGAAFRPPPPFPHVHHPTRYHLLSPPILSLSQSLTRTPFPAPLPPFLPRAHPHSHYDPHPLPSTPTPAPCPSPFVSPPPSLPLGFYPTPGPLAPPHSHLHPHLRLPSSLPILIPSPSAAASLPPSPHPLPSVSISPLLHKECFHFVRGLGGALSPFSLKCRENGTIGRVSVSSSCALSPANCLTSRYQLQSSSQAESRRTWHMECAALASAFRFCCPDRSLLPLLRPPFPLVLSCSFLPWHSEGKPSRAGGQFRAVTVELAVSSFLSLIYCLGRCLYPSL
ncbi:hypothetical protein C7M84_005625 [Penaeus vannamei]|uniref:Uncharacterized protein n=1 Tax=Penaeus vannamei TaxID=6689 RepID=A0A3R7PFV1_PENVA|nr:hypothetical protein C7M84_005625 [Penaeus vannamei]